MRRREESERLDQSAHVRLDVPGGLASEDLIGLGLTDLLSAFPAVESLVVAVGARRGVAGNSVSREVRGIPPAKKLSSCGRMTSASASSASASLLSNGKEIGGFWRHLRRGCDLDSPTG